MNKKLLITLLTISLSITGCEKVSDFFGYSKGSTDKYVSATTSSNDGSIRMLLPDFTELVENEGSAVVNIQASKIDLGDKPEATDSDPFNDSDPFSEFFKRLAPQLPDIFQQEDQESLNFGSGFIISSDGYILTNTHVVGDMNYIKVLLNDKKEYVAKLIGFDQQTDVALLKIDAKDLPVVTVGDPKKLKPGEWVAAIGAPFGFDNSVTAGIVSAIGRSLPNENYTPFIQTDVAINPGNSGGPLFNLNGQVVGINSQIYSRSGGFMGISFAIPIDVAMNVSEQLKTTGSVQRAKLGATVQEVSYDLSKSFGLENPSGALITNLISNGPAEIAGVHEGDIVQFVDDNEVKSSNDLPIIIGAMKPGQTVTLTVWRDQKALKIAVKLGDMNRAISSNTTNTSNRNRYDATIEKFSIDNLGLNLQLINNRIIVAKSTGLGLRAGIKRGDEILSIGQVKVTDESSLRAAIASAGVNIPLLIRRGDTMSYVAINLP